MDVSELFSIRGKTALVTGGSVGIGFMVAEGFVRAGVRVYICSRKAPDIAAAAENLSALGHCIAFVGDVATTDGVEAIRDQFSRYESRLDILVNNAGTTWGAKLEDFPRSAFEKVLNVNIAAHFDMVRTLLPLLEAGASAEDPARVINITSISSQRIRRGSTAYAYNASKAGAEMLTRHLAEALVDRHINVNAIAPGLFPSRMSAPMFDPDDPLFKVRFNAPMNRPGSPDDMVGTAIYLASRASNYLTGATIPLAGGVGTIS